MDFGIGGTSVKVHQQQKYESRSSKLKAPRAGNRTNRSSNDPSSKPNSLKSKNTRITRQQQLNNPPANNLHFGDSLNISNISPQHHSNTFNSTTTRETPADNPSHLINPKKHTSEPTASGGQVY